MPAEPLLRIAALRKSYRERPVLRNLSLSLGHARILAIDDSAARTLPGVRYRRHLLWRYSLLWRKPG